MWITWWIFVGWLLSLCLRLTKLFQNQVERMFPAFFNCLHLQDNWEFSWHMLSEMKSLPEKSSWVGTSGLLLRFFLLKRMLCHCFLHSNLTTTVWRSSSFTSWPVRDKALQMLLSRISSPITAETGFISSDS